MSTTNHIEIKHRELSDLISDIYRSIKEDGEFHKVFRYPRATYVGLVKLNNMIGMNFVKKVINRMINKYIVYILDDIQEDEEDSSLHHILLMGPPATGKSSVAEIIGYIMSASGIIEEPTPEVLASLCEREKKNVSTNLTSQSKNTNNISTSWMKPRSSTSTSFSRFTFCKHECTI